MKDDLNATDKDPYQIIKYQNDKNCYENEK